MNRDDLLTALQSNNLQAFLHVLREGETNNDDIAYRMVYGGTLFDAPPWIHPNRAVEKAGRVSTAAGAYQFLLGTWNEIQSKYALPDFSPQWQDAGAVALIARRNALEDVINGRLDAAIRKCGQEWASLPGSPYGQPTKTLAKCLETYLGYGGVLATDRVATTPQASKPETVKEKSMGPWVIPILQGLTALIPQLGSLFANTEVSQRNVAAASAVASAITSATNSVNLQEAAERMQSDTQALQAARQAVSDIWPTITEAGGGGIDGARKAAVGPSAQAPFWHQGAFWISLVLIAMPFMLLVDAFYVHPDSYDGNLRTQIVTAVLLVISIVGAFWLGSSFGSQKKDSLLAGRQ